MAGKGTKADCRLSLAAHHGIGVCTEHALALIVNTDEIEIFAALLKIVFYSVFSQAVDAQFVIYRSNGLYLLLRIKVSGRNPFNKFIAAHLSALLYALMSIYVFLLHKISPPMALPKTFGSP